MSTSKLNKKNLLAAALAGAVALGASSALAAVEGMEKCKIVDADGKGMIKEKPSSVVALEIYTNWVVRGFSAMCRYSKATRQTS